MKIKPFSKKACDLRCDLPREITGELLLEVYKKLSLGDGAPRLDDKKDPEKLLRLSAGAWTLSCWLDNCGGKEVRKDGAWYVILGENREYQDHPDYLENAAEPGHWTLKKGKKPHWIDYRISWSEKFDPHALIDLHFYLLDKARTSNKYSEKHTEALNQWAMEQAAEGSTD